MKLLNYTTTYFAGLLLALISVWAVLFYFAMFDEIYDSIDDGLQNQKLLIIQRAKKDPSIFNETKFDESNYLLQKVDFANYRDFKDTYTDTLMYMQNEEDYEPVRMLQSVFQDSDQYYKIKVITSMIEEDDQISNLLRYILGLYAVLVISILVLNNFFLRKVWRPFYKLLEQLKGFKIEKDQHLNFQKTNIEEFELLNQSIEKLLRQAKESYTGQKQFIENASHELQTPLAIGINKLEMLLEQNGFNEAQAAQLISVLENLEHLTRLNKSLLLISKIENDQFVEKEKLNLIEILQNSIADFSELAAFKQKEIHFSSEGNPVISMNKDLAEILFANLIKNALAHGTGSVGILVKPGSVIIKNASGAELDQNSLFKRFSKPNPESGSNGLGLAISKAIADKYGLSLTYRFLDSTHVFTVGLPSKP